MGEWKSSALAMVAESVDRRGDTPATTDRYQAFNMGDFRRKPPVIKDFDPDLDAHDREFQLIHWKATA